MALDRSCQENHVHAAENVILLVRCDHMFSQEGALQKDQSVLKISRNTGIRQSSVGRIIHNHRHPSTQERIMCVFGYKVSSDCVSTQLG